MQRGGNPIGKDFDNYAEAKPFLISRIGSGWYGNIQVANYCSYCERPISTNLAVEHVQPKGLKVGSIQPYKHLHGRWENFLLACVNCNSTKGEQDVVLDELLLPDRDNTFIAYDYAQDGTVSVAITGPARHLAAKTLEICGLDKPATQNVDDNHRAIALERISQRMNSWGLAQSAKQEVDAEPDSHGIRNCVVKLALAQGFFSVWMKVFQNDIDMRIRLIKAFSGTHGSGCFDPETTASISPAPNPDGLPHGGKL